MRHNGRNVVGALIALLFAAIAGGALVMDSIAGDCRAHGSFMSRGQVFECHSERE